VSRRIRVMNSANASQGLIESKLVGGIEEEDGSVAVGVAGEGKDSVLKGHHHAGSTIHGTLDQSTPSPPPVCAPLMPPSTDAPFLMSFWTIGHSRIWRAMSGFSTR